MLVDLSIKNFAIVEDGNFSFTRELSVFSGETGAGKSLLLDAITLLLGVRGGSDMVRSSADFAEVEGVFDLSRFSEHLNRLENLGFPIEEDSPLLVVRRQIGSKDKSKNRVWIQGRSATRTQLQELLGDLVEISGQHEFLRLGREDYLLSVLDQFASHSKLAESYQDAYARYQQVESELAELKKASVDREDRIAYLKFQVEEFQKAGVSTALVDEESELLAQRNRLGSIENLRQASESAFLALAGTDENPGLTDIFTKVLSELRSFRDCGRDFTDLVERSEGLDVLLKDLKVDFEKYINSLELDPTALEEAESRISALNRIKRKHSKETCELVGLLQNWTDELTRLESLDFDIGEKETAVQVARSTLEKLGNDLHERRLKFAEELSLRWQKDLSKLGMKDARMVISCEKLSQFRESGITRIAALFSANPGEDLKALTKVASGGELSRIMLSLKSLVHGRPEVGVYLFDEVDAGIGGATAHLVAERLKALSEEHQVLVVTHLGAIAAAAAAHWRVEKISRKGQTKTLVQSLDPQARVSEIARMLGGDSDSPEAQKLAEKLIQKYAAGASRKKASRAREASL